MRWDAMTLRVVLPLEVLLEQEGVTDIVVETTQGRMGFRPLRLDCVAFVIPGILTYETKDGKKSYVALDEGVLVKSGPSVTLSIHGGAAGPNLGTLEATVEEEFMKERERERQVRHMLERLELSFMRRCVEGLRRGY
jgi:F-type H+-transporting ATPase subunit epsilon